MALDAVLQRFQLIEVIGRGGMGVVYRAHDPQLLRDVAIKVLSSECVPASLRSHRTIDLRAAGPVVHDELIEEARVMAQLSHPNVLPVYEVGLDGEAVFLVMEHIAGANLREWLAGGPTLEAILDAFAQAGEGLEAAHARGVVHRDFKPENVLVGSDGRVRVADFGLSRLAGPRTAVGSPIRVTGARGTPEYMAPEAWHGEATSASDVFAFCIAVLEGIVGERTAEVARIEGALRERRVSPGLRAVVLAGIDEDPARRPAVGEIVAQLRGGRRRSRGRWIAAGAVAAVAIGGLAGAVVWRAGEDGPSCVDDASVLAGRWDGPLRARTASFLQPDGAQATVEGARRVLGALDDHARQIVAMGTATCRAGRDAALTAAQVAVRRSCLERRAMELGGVVARILGAKWDLAADEERAQSPTAVDSCRVIEAPVMRDRAAAAALYKQLTEMPVLAQDKRGAVWEQLERDGAALGEAEIEVRAAIGGASWLREADQLKRADEGFQRAYRRAIDIRAEGYAATALVERANLASRYGDPAGALSLAKLALEVADRPGVSVQTRARIYTGLGRAEYERGENVAAVEKLKKALELLTTNQLKTGVNELQIRSFLIASLNNIDGRNREAVALTRESLALARQVSGEESLNYAILTNALAIGLRNGGDLEGALAHRKKALDIVVKVMPPDHSRVVLQRTDYADDLLAAGQFEQARREFEAGLAQCNRNEALRSFRANLRGGLAGALWELGRHAEAVRLLEQTIAELTSQIGKDHRRTLYFVRMLAEYEIDLGLYDAAARHIAAVEDGYRAQPQANEARAVRLRGTGAAHLATARGDARGGEAIARKALAELAELKAEGEHDVLAALAASLVAQRRWADAKDVLDRVRASEPGRQQLLRPDRVALTDLLVAQTEYGLGRRGAAIELARHARDVLEGFPGQPKARAQVAAFLANVERARR